MRTTRSVPVKPNSQPSTLKPRNHEEQNTNHEEQNLNHEPRNLKIQTETHEEQNLNHEDKKKQTREAVTVKDPGGCGD